MHVKNALSTSSEVKPVAHYTRSGIKPIPATCLLNLTHGRDRAENEQEVIDYRLISWCAEHARDCHDVLLADLFSLRTDCPSTCDAHVGRSPIQEFIGNKTTSKNDVYEAKRPRLLAVGYVRSIQFSLVT